MMIGRSRFASTTRPQADKTFAGHGIANDGECFEANLVAWRNVVRRVVVARIDLLPGNESIELDRTGVLDDRTRRRRRRDDRRRVLALCRHSLEIRLDEYLHRFFARIDLDTNGRISKIDLVSPPVPAPDDGVGHLSSPTRNVTRIFLLPWLREMTLE